MNYAAKREDVREAEVVSLDGRDLVTLFINGQAFQMNAATSKMLGSDLVKAAKRTGAVK